MPTPDPRIIGYNSVRRALGLIGIGLPILLLIYALLISGDMQPSISDFYHTAMGDVLVGALCAIGVFLISYRGYPRDGKLFGDNWVSSLAGCSAIGVALFPARYTLGDTCPTLPCHITGFTFHPGWLHLSIATVFFACLAVFCFVLFPKGKRDEISRNRKKAEDVTYKTCGVLLVGAIIAIAGYELIRNTQAGQALTRVNFVFWVETVGIIAFAVSWLTKGKTIAGVKSLVARGAAS